VHSRQVLLLHTPDGQSELFTHWTQVLDAEQTFPLVQSVFARHSTHARCGEHTRPAPQFALVKHSTHTYVGAQTCGAQSLLPTQSRQTPAGSSQTWPGQWVSSVHGTQVLSL